MSEPQNALVRRGVRGVRLEAQAKLNLRLRVLAREDNGYHQIETLFLRLELADTVQVRRTSGGRSLDVGGDVDLSAMGPVEQNLAWRAAEAYLAASGERDGFAIEIGKRIPLGGGLGGGSADAGAVLRALDATSETPMHRSALLSIASTLGADVPFLASGLPYALAWGRGERMLGLNVPRQRAVVLAFPDFSVNTAEAYGWLDEWRVHPPPGAAEPVSVLNPFTLSDWDEISGVAVNDFQEVVARRHPAVRSVSHALNELGCVISMMSGSGSSMFGISGPGPVAETAVRGITPASLAQSSLRELDVALRVVHTATASRVEPVLPIE